MIDLDKVKNYWLDKLSVLPKAFGNEELADMLEETNWFKSNFQQAFVELQEDGRVKNLDAIGKRPKKPVHFKKNERLQRI